MEVWIDHQQVRPGNDVVKALSEGMGTSKYAIIFYSSNYARETWTNAEMNAMIYTSVVANERRLFVVQFDAAELPPLLSSRVAFRGKGPHEVAQRIRETLQVDRADLPQNLLIAPESCPAQAIDLQQLEGEVVEELGAKLCDFRPFWKFNRTERGPAQQLQVFLRGHGAASVTLRNDVAEKLLFDLKTEQTICEQHHKYVRYLREALATGGLGVISPAFRMKIDEKFEEVIHSQSAIRNYLNYLVEEIKLC